MSTEKHSPMPWRICNVVLVDATATGPSIYTHQRPLDRDCPHFNANQRLVVRCVNAHDALIEALEGMLRIGLVATSGYVSDEIVKAQAALKLAKS